MKEIFVRALSASVYAFAIIGSLLYNEIIFYSILFRAILKTQRILSLTKKMKIKFIIVSTLSYANNDAIFLRVGLKKKIRVVECHHFHNKTGLLVYNKII